MKTETSFHNTNTDPISDKSPRHAAEPTVKHNSDYSSDEEEKHESATLASYSNPLNPFLCLEQFNDIFCLDIGENLEVAAKPGGVEPGSLTVDLTSPPTRKGVAEILQQTPQNATDLSNYLDQHPSATKKVAEVARNELLSSPSQETIKMGGHLIKQDYRDTIKNRVAPEIKRLAGSNTIRRLPFILRQIALCFYYLFRLWRGKRKRENKNAILESLATNVAKAHGMVSHKQRIQFRTYKSGSPKVVTDSSWEKRFKEYPLILAGTKYNEKVIVQACQNPAGKFLPDEYGKHKLKKSSDGHYYADDSIKVADNFALFICQNDKDGIGTNGQNKGRLDNELYGIDFGQAYREANKIIDQLYDNCRFKVPEEASRHIKNISIFDDTLLSERIQGVLYLYKISSKELCAEIFPMQEERERIDRVIVENKNISPKFAKRIDSIKSGAEDAVFENYIKLLRTISGAIHSLKTKLSKQTKLIIRVNKIIGKYKFLLSKNDNQMHGSIDLKMIKNFYKFLSKENVIFSSMQIFDEASMLVERKLRAKENKQYHSLISLRVNTNTLLMNSLQTFLEDCNTKPHEFLQGRYKAICIEFKAHIAAAAAENGLLAHNNYRIEQNRKLLKFYTKLPSDILYYCDGIEAAKINALAARKKMLQLCKEKMLLLPMELDLLDNLEKLSCRTSPYSADNKVILKHLRVLPHKEKTFLQYIFFRKPQENRIAWHLSRFGEHIQLKSAPMDYKNQVKLFKLLQEYLKKQDNTLQKEFVLQKNMIGQNYHVFIVFPKENLPNIAQTFSEDKIRLHKHPEALAHCPATIIQPKIIQEEKTTSTNQACPVNASPEILNISINIRRLTYSDKHTTEKGNADQITIRKSRKRQYIQPRPSVSSSLRPSFNSTTERSTDSHYSSDADSSAIASRSNYTGSISFSDHENRSSQSSDGYAISVDSNRHEQNVQTEIDKSTPRFINNYNKILQELSQESSPYCTTPLPHTSLNSPLNREIRILSDTDVSSLSSTNRTDSMCDKRDSIESQQQEQTTQLGRYSTESSTITYIPQSQDKGDTSVINNASPTIDDLDKSANDAQDLATTYNYHVIRR